MSNKQALDGVKVVDFSWVIAGPITTKHLADHGAEVIRIESSDHPDTIRSYTPYKDGIPGINRSAFFASFNSNKYSVNLNIRDPRGMDIAKELIARGDVVVENFTPGVMDRLGIGYQDIKQIKPDIIMASAGMQGATGPHCKHPGFGLMLQCLAGFASVTGWPDGEPFSPMTYIDFIPPWYLVVAIVIALDHRNKTGKGQHIDLSQLESGIQFLAPGILDYTANGRVQGREGNRAHSSAPHGIYHCQEVERWCSIAVENDEEWVSFCRVIDNPSWTQDPKFATFLGRKENEDELDRLIREWTVNHSAEEVMTLMQESGVPAGVVYNSEDFHHDPQLKHRGHFWVLDHPEIGPYSNDGPSFRLSKTPAHLHMPSPCLGEHNEYVCCNLLGMSDEEFTDLLQAGVIK